MIVFLSLSDNKNNFNSIFREHPKQKLRVAQKAILFQKEKVEIEQTVVWCQQKNLMQPKNIFMFKRSS